MPLSRLYLVLSCHQAASSDLLISGSLSFYLIISFMSLSRFSHSIKPSLMPWCHLFRSGPVCPLPFLFELSLSLNSSMGELGLFLDMTFLLVHSLCWSRFWAFISGCWYVSYLILSGCRHLWSPFLVLIVDFSMVLMKLLMRWHWAWLGCQWVGLYGFILYLYPLKISVHIISLSIKNFR
jgi:hypothetical protein